MYLAHRGNPEKLIDELLGLETGCCRGRGGSPGIQDSNIPMYGHHGLVGENIPLATGYALATKKPTLVYLGDAAAEEDYALSSFGFAATHKLPILYICEDNGLSILTPIKDRRKWHTHKVAKSMGLHTIDIEDEPMAISLEVEQALNRLPAFINIHTTRHHWHVGIGVDHMPSIDRLVELRQQVFDADGIERKIATEVKELWEKQLQKLSKK